MLDVRVLCTFAGRFDKSFFQEMPSTSNYETLLVKELKIQHLKYLWEQTMEHYLDNIKENKKVQLYVQYNIKAVFDFLTSFLNQDPVSDCLKAR